MMKYKKYSADEKYLRGYKERKRVEEMLKKWARYARIALETSFSFFLPYGFYPESSFFERVEREVYERLLEADKEGKIKVGKEIPEGELYSLIKGVVMKISELRNLKLREKVTMVQERIVELFEEDYFK